MPFYSGLYNNALYQFVLEWQRATQANIKENQKCILLVCFTSINFKFIREMTLSFTIIFASY